MSFSDIAPIILLFAESPNLGFRWFLWFKKICKKPLSNPKFPSRNPKSAFVT
jgi:hypothetical protein